MNKHTYKLAIITQCETRDDGKGFKLTSGIASPIHEGDEIPADKAGNLIVEKVPIELFICAAASRKVGQIVFDFLNLPSTKESIEREVHFAKIVFNEKKAERERAAKGGAK